MRKTPDISGYFVSFSAIDVLMIDLRKLLREINW
jgi:hypothetical protein